MKRILFFILLIASYLGVNAQANKTILPLTGGTNGVYHVASEIVDSFEYKISGCGVPTRNVLQYMAKKRGSGEYVDTCGNRPYWYSPSDNTWFTVSGGGGNLPYNGDSSYYLGGDTLLHTFSPLVVVDETGGTSRLSNDTLYINPLGSGGGSGISEVVAGYGLLNVNDSTLKVDTSLIATQYDLTQIAFTDSSIDYAVINILNTPPVSPSSGDKYLVGTSPTGAWIGHANEIATWNGAAWVFTTATQGQLLSNQNNDGIYKFTGSAWIATTIPVHQKGDNFGANVNVIIGNKKNKELQFLTNNTVRGGFQNSGSFYLNNVGVGSTSDSLASITAGGVIQKVVYPSGGSAGNKLDTTYATYYNVTRYGVRNDSTTGSALALQTLINWIPKGSTLYFPAGNYKIDTTIRVNKSLSFLGDGGGGTMHPYHTGFVDAATIIYNTSTTASIFYLDSPNVKFEDVMILNRASTTPSAGSGIFAHNAQNMVINKCSITAFYNAINITNYAFWKINLTSISGYHYGVRIADSASNDDGDAIISNCNLFNARNGDTVIYQESGGGLRITGCKGLSGTGSQPNYYYLGNFGGSVATQNLIIANNSFEWFSVSAIKVVPNALFYGNINITGNEIEAFGTAVTNDIDIASCNSVSITGNTMTTTTPSSTAIKLNTVVGATINNAYYNYTSPVSLTSITNSSSIDRGVASFFNDGGNSGGIGIVPISFAATKWQRKAVFQGDSDIIINSGAHSSTGAAGVVDITAGGFNNNFTARFTNGSPGNAIFPGSVTIGSTSAPTVPLDISGSSADMINMIGSNSVRATFNMQATDAGAQATIYCQNNRGSFASYGGWLYGGSTNAIGNLFGVSRADKLFIFADGGNNLGMCVGTLANTSLILGTNNAAAVTISNAQAVRFNTYGAGAITADASGNLTSVSDERVKNILGYSHTGLDAIMRIHPINFKYNGLSGNETFHTYTGLSAQNVKDNIPNGTGETKDGYLTLQDRAVMAAMIVAIQEQQKEIEELKSEIKHLKKK